MISIYDLGEKADISRETIYYRLKQLQKRGMEIKSEYVTEDSRPIRIFTDEIAEQIINWRGAKPGRKKQK